jgi:exopolysaccharide biosynthesis polyprenyl glycosylphosphotransferase
MMKMNIDTRNKLTGLLRSRHGTRWVFSDLLMGFFSFLIAMQVTPYSDKVGGEFFAWIALGYGLCVMLSSIAVGVPLAGKDHDAALYEIAVLSFMAVVLAVMIFALVSSFLFFTIFGRYILLFASLGTFLGMVLFRWMVFFFHGRSPIRIFLVGAIPEQTDELAELFGKGRGFKIVCEAGASADGDAQVIELNRSNWIESLTEQGVDTVILCSEDTSSAEETRQLLELPLHGMELFSYGSFLETFFKRIPIGNMSAKEVAAIRIQPGNDAIFISKRAMDVLISGMVLLLSLPVWILIAVAVKLDSPGSLFFVQERDGAGDTTFRLIKFRTMRGEADASTDDDHRITAVGRILRRTRLDELPQLLNVLKGDMSLVGPRPECSAYTQEFKEKIPYYAYRRLVKPGLTGWAQMRFRYSKSLKEVEQKFQYDLYYIRHVSFRLDMCILMKTIPLLMKGSR